MLFRHRLLTLYTFYNSVRILIYLKFIYFAFWRARHAISESLSEKIRHVFFLCHKQAVPDLCVLYNHLEGVTSLIMTRCVVCIKLYAKWLDSLPEAISRY